MLINEENEVSCLDCKKTHKVREYVGMEGGYYSDHLCKERKSIDERNARLGQSQHKKPTR